MNEIRMCVVFCLQMKKKSSIFLFGGHFKKNERKDKRRDLYNRNLFSSFNTLIISFLNQLSRANERRNEKYD